MSIKNIPVLVLNKVELLPFFDIRLDFDDNIIKNTIEIAEKHFNNELIIVFKEDPLEANVELGELLKVGILSNITMNMGLPSNKRRVNLHGVRRVEIDEFYIEDDIVYAKVSPILINEIPANEELAYIKLLKNLIIEYINNNPYVSNEFVDALKDIHDLDHLTDLIAMSLDFSNDLRQEFLIEMNSILRAKKLISEIRKDFEIVELEKKIDEELGSRLDKNQRDFVLQEKMKLIKEELGLTKDSDSEISELKNRLNSLDLKIDVYEKILKEINRLEGLNPSISPDYNMILNYINLMLELPWNTYTEDLIDFDSIRSILDKNHFGLDQVKERILEYIAVIKNTSNEESPILCFVGPPGVGKTTFAKSIADALNRKCTKISVGGINDEADIVGHRRTYIGAMPGLIIQGMRKVKVSNPVFIIDEIDKMTKGIHGDPASSLLEVLDKEQNTKFIDHYVEEEYDLSKVMFVTTANYIEQIPVELVDRLEIIELSSYTEYEKVEILKNYIIPKRMKDYHLDSSELTFSDSALITMINLYTRESGVREAERLILKILRRYIKNKMITGKENVKITKDNLVKYLDRPKYIDIFEEEAPQIGLVNGLSYTPYGGNVLKVEGVIYPGNGDIKLTGSLGDVLRESALLSLSYLKANAKLFDIKEDMFKKYDIHIHFEEGAVKKDGPSAGITLTTVLLSLLTNTKVPSNIAMTGEMTLRGKVLPIGGLKEKIIGAYNQNITKVFIPKGNREDIEQIDEKIRKEINFVEVDSYLDVYKELFPKKIAHKKNKIDDDMLIKLDL